jgi:hypothetical protein
VSDINYEPVIIETPEMTETSGPTAADVTRSPRQPTTTIKIAIRDMPGGSTDRILGAGVDAKGQAVVVWIAGKAGRQFVPLDPAEHNPAVAWLVKLDVYDRGSETTASYYLSDAAGYTDGELPTADAWTGIVTDVAVDEEGAVATISIATDARRLDEQIQTETMPGLDQAIRFLAAEASLMTVPHAAVMLASTYLRVDAIVRLASITPGVSQAVIVKGPSLAGAGTAEWSIIVNTVGTWTARLVDAGGVTKAVVNPTPAVVGQLHHVILTWDGTALRLMVDGTEEPTPTPMATIYAGRSGAISHGRISTGGAPMDGDLLTARMYVDLSPQPTAADLRGELYSFADDSLFRPLIELKITAGIGNNVVNMAEPGVHDATLTGFASAWVYGGTGTEADAGRPWPLPYGFVTTPPVFGDRQVSTPVSHVMGPGTPRISCLDAVRAGGEGLHVDDPDRPTSVTIEWGPDGAGGGVIREIPAGGFPSPFRLAWPFRGFRRGGLLQVTGVAALPFGPGGTVTVKEVFRAGDVRYGRVLTIEESIIVGGSGAATITLGEPPDVTLLDDRRTLAWAAAPDTKVTATFGTERILGVGGPAELEQPSVYAVIRYLVERSGITWPAANEAEIADRWDNNQHTTVGLDLTGLTYRQALDLVVLGLGSGWSWTIGRGGGLDISQAIIPTGATDVELDDATAWGISVVASYPSQPRWTVRYRRNDAPLTEGELLPIAREGRPETELHRILSAAEEVTSTVATAGEIAPDALSGDRRNLDAALVVKNHARQTANQSARFWGSRLRVIELTTGAELTTARPRRTTVTLRTARIPSGDEIKGVIIAITARGAETELQILAEDP